MKEMATHSSILAWEVPWTEEPGRLQSMRSQELDTTEWLNNNNNISLAKWEERQNLILFFLSIFWLHWVFVAGSGLSLVAASRGYSLAVVCRLASHCGGSSCCAAWALVAPMARGIFPEQGSNLYPRHWKADSYPLYHQGSPKEIFLHLVWGEGGGKPCPNIWEQFYLKTWEEPL